MQITTVQNKVDDATPLIFLRNLQFTAQQIRVNRSSCYRMQSAALTLIDLDATIHRKDGFFEDREENQNELDGAVLTL